MVVILSTPNCVQCNATYRSLDKRSIPYEKIDITEDEMAREYVAELGYTHAPVVFYGDDHWSGFRPDKIEALPAG